jgi:hypothetical protein
VSAKPSPSSAALSVGLLPHPPGLVVAVEQRHLLQIRIPVQQAVLLDQIRMRHRHHPFVEELFHVQIRIVTAPEAQRHVDRRPREVHQFAGGMEAQLDVRMLAPEGADPWQQPHLQERGEQRNLQRSAALVLPDVLQGRFELIKAGTHAGQKFQALVGHFHAPAVAAKQRHLQIVLERLDLLAHRRRGHVERVRRRAETQARGHRFEHTQRAQRESVEGLGHLKFLLTGGQVLRLLPGRRALIVAPIEVTHFTQEYSIMNVNSAVTRFAYAVLAMALVLAEGVVFQTGVI